MAQKLFLYWGSGSIPCWKVMMALEEKGLTGYPNKLISFDNNEQRSEDILKWNPRGQVPTFKDGNTIINESAAICDYVEAPNLFRALVEDVVYYQFDHTPENTDQDHLKKKKKEAREELQRWEDYLEKEGEGSYIAGPDFSMADVAVYPSLAFAVRCRLPLHPSFPRLQAYYDNVSGRPSVLATSPPHWAGTQGSDYYHGF